MALPMAGWAESNDASRMSSDCRYSISAVIDLPLWACMSACSWRLRAMLGSSGSRHVSRTSIDLWCATSAWNTTHWPSYTCLHCPGVEPSYLGWPPAVFKLGSVLNHRNAVQSSPAAAADGICTKLSQSTSCQCKKFAQKRWDSKQRSGSIVPNISDRACIVPGESSQDSKVCSSLPRLGQLGLTELSIKSVKPNCPSWCCLWN